MEDQMTEKEERKIRSWMRLHAPAFLTPHANGEYFLTRELEAFAERAIARSGVADAAAIDFAEAYDLATETAHEAFKKERKRTVWTHDDLAGVCLSEACDLHSPEAAVDYIIEWCRHEAELLRAGERVDADDAEAEAENLEALAARLDAVIEV